MKQVQLLFSNNVLLEDARSMKLDYCLTEKTSESDHLTPYYGAKITKYLEGNVETEEICGISASKETVISMIKKLYLHEVTPISMVEIVDELVTDGVSVNY